MRESNNKSNNATFGFKKVSEIEKTSLVNDVFTSVTKK